jgi:hypothetical protein
MKTSVYSLAILSAMGDRYDRHWDWEEVANLVTRQSVTSLVAANLALMCCGMAQAGQLTINQGRIDKGLMQAGRQAPTTVSPSTKARLAQTAPTEVTETLSFATLEGLFTLQLAGRERQVIPAPGGDGIINHLGWSADGQQLAIVQDYNHVYLIAPQEAASLPTQIFASECLQPPDIQLFWQRDGNHLLIQQRCTSLNPNEASRLELFVTDLSGRLTTLAHLPSHPDSDYYLSPDRSEAAYVLNQHIYVADISGNTTQQLTETPGDYGAAGSPLVWSPDGSQLAFFEGEYPFQKINVINTDGTDRRVLTPNQNFQIYRSRLLWSPNGRYLAFYQPYNPPYSNQEVISLINVSSGEIRPISLPGFYTEMNWSPDSRQLSVAGGMQFEQQLLYVVDIDTGRFTQLTPEPFHRIPSHAWAPQGDWLAFTATPLGVELASPVLYVVRPDGTNLSALTTGNEYVFPFAWRPMP